MIGLVLQLLLSGGLQLLLPLVPLHRGSDIDSAQHPESDALECLQCALIQSVGLASVERSRWTVVPPLRSLEVDVHCLQGQQN